MSPYLEINRITHTGTNMGANTHTHIHTTHTHTQIHNNNYPDSHNTPNVVISTGPNPGVKVTEIHLVKQQLLVHQLMIT